MSWYNRSVIKERITMDEIEKKLQNPNLSESERRMLEIAKETGLKRII